MQGVSLHYSKVGYDIGKKINILVSVENEKKPVRATLNTNYSQGHSVTERFSATPISYGEKWGKTWYKFDFSHVDKIGTYILKVEFEDKTTIQSEHLQPVDIGKNLLWHRAWYAVSLEQLDVRRDTAYYPEGGWRDCGSPLQEVSSHLIMLDSLCDLLKCKEVPKAYISRICEHICVGADYVCKCKDKAEKLGFKKGSVVHEIRENLNVSTGNCARVAVVLSRIYSLIKDTHPKSADKYLSAALESFNFIADNGPISYTDDTGNLKITHGATDDFSSPPNDYMTRDLLSLCEASLNFYDLGMSEYLEKANNFAKKVIARQVDKKNSEEGFYGHFYTYDNVDFTEKANLHCGAWDLPYKNYNQGSHMPYWILPLVRIAKIGGSDIAKECDIAIKNFAYGFLLPTTKQTPFGIIPLGFYKNEGLCFFSGCYHGHNKIYGFISKLATILADYLCDSDFNDIATDNMQWIAGLNCGIKENDEESYTSKSFIVGVGSVYHADWNNLRGTVINGFDSSSQFSVHPVKLDKDLPVNLDDEGGIHHSSGFLAGLCYYN